MMELTHYSRFNSACQSVLAFLHQHMGFSLWMVTRVHENDWIVLHVEQQGYNVKAGTVYRWSDSYCSRMVKGLGPRVAPIADEVPAYFTAPIGQQVPIGSYIGVPVTCSDGSLFGTLCAIDPDPQDDSIRDHLALVELYAGLLGSLLQTEHLAITQAQFVENLQLEASTDAMTGLLSRNGWERNIEQEEARSNRYGHPVSIFILDLDNLKQANDEHGHAEGDELIRRMARCLRMTLRDSDTVARLGGDEFAVLALDCGESAADKLLAKIRNALLLHRLNASVGCATRDPEDDISDTIANADVNMYVEKSRRKKLH